jgi:hypothetical protein
MILKRTQLGDEVKTRFLDMNLLSVPGQSMVRLLLNDPTRFQRKSDFQSNGRFAGTQNEASGTPFWASRVDTPTPKLGW